MAKGKNYTRRQVIGTMAAAIATTAVADTPAKGSSNEASPQVQTARVTRYSFGWNAGRRTGAVYLNLENRRDPVTINVASPEEFSGYVTILKEPQVFYDSNGWLFTGVQRPM